MKLRKAHVKNLLLMLILLVSVISIRVIAAERIVVLDTDSLGCTRVSGLASMADQRFCPASTIKIPIAWAGLDSSVISPETKIFCKDRFVPGAPRELDLHEALLYSSNDYFLEVARRLGQKRLEGYLKEAGLADSESLKTWLKKGFGEVVHGGDLKVSPNVQHQFIRKIQHRELVCGPEVLDRLEKALEWPSQNPGISPLGGLLGPGLCGRNVAPTWDQP